MNTENQNIEFKESWGRGWQKICDGFIAAGLPKPSIESKQGGVLVTFQRNNVNLNTTVVKSQESTQKEGDFEIMPNKENEEEKTTQKSGLKSEHSIIEAIIANPNVTIPILQEMTGLSRNGIKKALNRLKAQGIIRRVGPDKGGHWELLQQS